jgi:hypothetical protein
VTRAPLPAEEIERLKTLADAAFKDTPLPWNQDTEDSPWSHGIGDDVVEGCKTYAMFDGLGRRIFGSENNTAGEVHEESGEDGHYAWDDVGRRHFVFLEKLIELYPHMLAEIEAGRAGSENRRRLHVEAMKAAAPIIALAARDATLEEAATMFDAEASHATAEGLWIAAEIFTKHAALVRALKSGGRHG